MKTGEPSTDFAWCFSHGLLHHFQRGADPWCTAFWVPLDADTEEGAMAVKSDLYGQAQFIDGLPLEQQLEIMEAYRGRHRQEKA